MTRPMQPASLQAVVNYAVDQMRTSETRGRSREKDHYLRVLSDPWYRLLASMQNNVFHATAAFYQRRSIGTLHFPLNIQNVSSPIELGSDSAPVRVDICGVRSYLVDSMQFLLEYACRISPTGCFSFFPSYRSDWADMSHLSQFYNSEAEIPGHLGDAITVAEKYLRHLCRYVFAGCEELARELVGDISHVDHLGASRRPLPQVTLDEASKLIGRGRGYVRVNRQHGFRRVTREGERRLINEFGGAVWLTEPDHLAVPFYQGFVDKTRRSAKAADLLMGIGELVGLGERHSTPEATREALHLHGLPIDEYRWYIEIKTLRPMVTSGFGLGVERFFCWALRHNDIRDCQLFPRFRGKKVVV